MFGLRSGLRHIGWLIFVGAACAARAQQPPAPPPVHVTRYELEAIVDPAQQSLRARARIALVADRSAPAVTFELHPALQVQAVRSGTATLTVRRTAEAPDRITVDLPAALAPGQAITLEFDYAGTLADTASPDQPVRLAGIGSDRFWLLMPARWFPLVSTVGQRYSGQFDFIVPGNFTVVGTGQSGTPEPVAAPPGATTHSSTWLRYRFKVERPSPAGSFIGGPLQLTPVRAAGLSLSVYTPPALAGSAAAAGETLGKILEFYSATFGPIEERQVTLALLPADPGLESFSGPGLVVVTQPYWNRQPAERALATAAAGLWWNDQVLPATPADALLADGLARYSAVLYAESAHGPAALRREVTECSVGALMDEQAAPIAQAWRLAPYSLAYRSVVANKGAMVFHMLRRSIGDEPFRNLLRTYLTRFSGRTATLDDFEKLVQSTVAALPPVGGRPPLNTVAFFAQWVHSTGVPEFHLEYVVYRTPRGFRVVGKIHQDLTALNMPVTIRVETEGNPVTQVVRVVGNTTEFSIDTFGLPKPGGIQIDPDNDVLKATPDLRIRALIAQGEGLARQGRYFEAVQQYRRALDLQHNNALALFRLGEAMFYQKNYQAAANAFHDALDGEFQPDYRWVEVWSHIYLGKIYDLIGQRERAVNEYQKAVETRDDTDGAQAEAHRYLEKPYSGEADSRPGGP